MGESESEIVRETQRENYWTDRAESQLCFLLVFTVTPGTFPQGSEIEVAARGPTSSLLGHVTSLAPHSPVE